MPSTRGMRSIAWSMSVIRDVEMGGSKPRGAPRSLTLMAVAGVALVVFAAPANAYDRGGTTPDGFIFTSSSSGDHWPLRGS